MALGDDIELGEGLFLIGAFGLAIYLIYKALKTIPNPFGQGTISDTVVNAASGQLSDAQVEAAVQTEAAQVVAASGGSISFSDALNQARADQRALHGDQGAQVPVSIGTMVFGSCDGCNIIICCAM
jgi:hypothetical protein